MEAIHWPRIASVLVGCVVLIVATGYLAFTMRPCTPKHCPSFEEWIDQDTSAKSILVGAAAGAAFGIIDNTLLWVGMSAMDSLFARLPGGTTPNVLAGYGNAFSSVVSAFVSTFVGRIIADAFHVNLDKTPLWSMAFGILVGCVVGILVPLAVTAAVNQ